MRLLIISVAKAHYWVRCQPLQALDLLHPTFPGQILQCTFECIHYRPEMGFSGLGAINFKLLEMPAEISGYSCNV